MNLADLQHWDGDACALVNRVNRNRIGACIFAIASRLGDGVFWYSLMLLLPFLYGRQDLTLSLLMAGHGAACTLLYKAIKHGTKRPRPCAHDVRLALTVPPLDVFSFPSGHTLHAVGFTILTGWYHPELLWVLAPFTGLVAASRMVLGLHYPSDVLAGAAIGAGMAAAALAAFG